MRVVPDEVSAGRLYLITKEFGLLDLSADGWKTDPHGVALVWTGQVLQVG